VAFGIFLVVLIALLAVAVLVALAGYIYQIVKRPRGKKMEEAAKVENKAPGVASSKIDTEATPTASANSPPPPKTP
jgi:flagellar basal body-associated protein FliL